ncbi:winged helix-turn-helix transcriptional regulator [Gordonia sp. X0973]|uniref:Rv2640c family ArsR-like transcriptional regulator n=1 Tax=Gordonia sp. X0973 TaxID=2742602 RepID=UPI000F548FD5|nr:Rv2640c family ArsR-like transcriptional regulator [Gordonia sp. X0973]QKT07957.1 winged helix-turn-helix transcriptional regulator [Gordonia sp. X0973]
MPKPLPIVDVRAPICCAPIAAGPVSDGDAVELALRLKALADPVRIQLVALLVSAADGEMCASDLAAKVGVSAGTVSHHLNQLRNAGLVSSERRGVNIVYRAESVNLEALRAVLSCC